MWRSLHLLILDTHDQTSVAPDYMPGEFTNSMKQQFGHARLMLDYLTSRFVTDLAVNVCRNLFKSYVCGNKLRLRAVPAILC